MAGLLASILHSLRASTHEARRYVRANGAGLAAAATLLLIVFALLRRRFRTGMVLFQVAVALGEKWQEGRTRRRMGALLVARAEGQPSVPAGPASPSNGA